MDIEDQEKRAEYLKLMAEIGYLAVAVNEFTEFCVFFEFSGHVGHVSLTICPSKNRYNEEIASGDFFAKYRDAERPYKTVENASLLAKRDQLKSILEEHDLPYHDMTPVHEMHTTYEF